MISIILPTYNRGSILDKTINCVLEQTYTHFELIIIDDNSNDNTKDVVNSYNDSRIKYFYNSINQGCALSREVGFKHSKGDILVFIDDDDKWNKDKLSKQIMLIENYDMVISDYSIEKKDQIEKKNMRPFGEYFKDEILKRPGPFFQSVMIKKEIVNKMKNPFDQESVPSEDWNFFIELSKLDLKIAYLNESLFTWCVNNDSQSLNLKNEARALSYIVTKHFDYLCEKTSKKNISNHYRRIARIHEKLFLTSLETADIDKYYLKAFEIYPFSLKNCLYRAAIFFGYKRMRFLIDLMRRLRGVKNV
tara:strand:+ start:18259 stop:19173 length:915 start_codon:yes stop_codon:yes gene_type:complete